MKISLSSEWNILIVMYKCAGLWKNDVDNNPKSLRRLGPLIIYLAVTEYAILKQHIYRKPDWRPRINTGR